MRWNGELWAGTDNQSGFPGDTNFSVHGSPLPGYHHYRALPHQSPFSPDRADQWPRVMVVCPFVRRTVQPVTVTAQQDLRAVAKEKACHPTALLNVLLGG